MLTITQPVIFDQQKSPSYRWKEKVQEKNQNVANLVLQVLQFSGEKLGQKQTPDFKDEDELFGALIASQMRQIAP